MKKLLTIYVCCFCCLHLKAVETSLADTGRVLHLLKQSLDFQRTNVDSCFCLADYAYKLSEELGYEKGKRTACIRMGSALLTRSLYDSAKLYLREATVLSKSIGDPRGIAGALLLLSYVHKGKGSKDSALFVLYQSLMYSERARDTGLMIQNYTALSDVYEESEYYDLALTQLQKALPLSILAHLRGQYVGVLFGIGGIQYRKKNFATALKYYYRVDSMSTLMGDEISRAQNLNNIALCYGDLGQTRKALIYFDQALELYRKNELTAEESNTYFNLGCLYESLTKFDSAIYYFNKGISIASRIGEPDRMLKSYKKLADIYAKIKQYEKAYFYQEKYTALSDSLLNIEKVKSISEMQTKYETELKNQEIALLQRENDIGKLKASRSLGINFGLGGALLGIVCVAFAFYSQSKKKEKLNTELSFEKQKSDDLLLNILPEEVATELKQKGEAIARQYNNVTVLFTDFVNFTGLSEQMSPTELVHEIHQNFTAFDAIIEKHGLEKIKTIGDAYLAVCGLPNESPDHAQRVVKAALDIREYMALYSGKFEVRVGIHTGPVVAGIVGVKKYAYDIWGDTVNTASRMESTSEAGKINISTSTYELIKREFVCTYRGKINAKHKGEVDMYFVEQSLT